MREIEFSTSQILKWSIPNFDQAVKNKSRLYRSRPTFVPNSLIARLYEVKEENLKKLSHQLHSE